MPLPSPALTFVFTFISLLLVGYGLPWGSMPVPSPALTLVLTFMVIAPLWFWSAMWIEPASLTGFNFRFDFHCAYSSLQRST